MTCRECGRHQGGAINVRRLVGFAISAIVILWFAHAALQYRTAPQRAYVEAEREVRERREAIAAAEERAMAAVDALAERMPDEALRGCVRTAMENIAGITRGTDPAPLDGLDDIIDLQCPGEGVARLDGLARLPRLEVLNLNDNAIEDLSPLRELEHLEAVGLDGNPVADLAPLAYHPSLLHVSLEGTTVEKLDPVLTIPGLASLDLPDAVEFACEDARADLAATDIDTDEDPDSIDCGGF